MPAFVGFFIAVVIVLCLAIVLLIGRSIVTLVGRIRSARQRRRAVGAATTGRDDADRGDHEGSADGTSPVDADPAESGARGEPTSAGDRTSDGRDPVGAEEPASGEPPRTAAGAHDQVPHDGEADGPVYVCPQLHATWQERGNCPECDQRGVPMGG